MLQTAEEIIKYIGDAKKQTPIKMYLKGENLPDTDAFHLFGDSHFKIAIGDLDAINAYVEENKDLIKDSFIEQDNAVIMMGAVINIGAKIGEGSMIDMGAVLGGRAEVGKHCHVVAGAVLAGVIEPPSASPVILEDDVLIGANAVVIEGVHIGKGAVVGAGSIVTQDIPAGAVVVGNQARIIKEQKDEKTEGKTQLMDDLRKI